MRVYKLNQKEAAKIREQYLKKVPLPDLAMTYHVSLPTIRSIVRYDRYLPALSAEQQKKLEQLSNKFGCTRDHMLDMLFTRGIRAIEDIDI
jgi:hypothetical protein